jgi:hypothetical protein
MTKPASCLFAVLAVSALVAAGCGGGGKSRSDVASCLSGAGIKVHEVPILSEAKRAGAQGELVYDAKEGQLVSLDFFDTEANAKNWASSHTGSPSEVIGKVFVIADRKPDLAKITTCLK